MVKKKFIGGGAYCQGCSFHFQCSDEKVFEDFVKNHIEETGHTVSITSKCEYSPTTKEGK